MVWLFGFGLVSGFIITKYTSGREAGGKPHLLKFKFRKYRIHVHHWIHQMILLMAITILHIKETWTLPPWLFQGIVGASSGSIIHGLRYPDWKRIVWKED